MREDADGRSGPRSNALWNFKAVLVPGFFGGFLTETRNLIYYAWKVKARLSLRILL